MNSLVQYLLGLNIALMILFVAYKLFFEKDRNFIIRRVFLLGAILLPALLPLLPGSLSTQVGNIAPLSITLDEITILGENTGMETVSKFSFGSILLIIYLLIVTIGLGRLMYQFMAIIRTALRSDRFEIRGNKLLASGKLHASSFFGFIFMDPARTKETSLDHILAHENIHKREWHSLDRILAEVFVIINWFNPVAWLLRNSIIQNLEFLADTAVIRKGTDPLQYQMSILNQYIGSASITNQFSSQIKNRIKMLNKNNKTGSHWKLILLIPVSLMAFFFVACTNKEAPVENIINDQLFTVVEEMPSFNDDDSFMEFRKYIATNLIYPDEAKENGVVGKVFIKFIVDKDGKVQIPDQELLAESEGKPIDEVVVAAYRPLKEGEAIPDEKYITLLTDEVKRVVSNSPDWKPGKQRGKNVSVIFTFPVTFALQ